MDVAGFQQALLWLLQFLVAGFCTVLWFNYRDLKNKSETTAKELAQYQLHIAENYVTQSELAKAIESLIKSIDAVFAKLERIDTKLDHKQDK